MADVIAICVVDVVTTEADVIACVFVLVGWCYCQVADGIATVGWWMLSG